MLVIDADVDPIMQRHFLFRTPIHQLSAWRRAPLTVYLPAAQLAADGGFFIEHVKVANQHRACKVARVRIASAMWPQQAKHVVQRHYAIGIGFAQLADV